MNRTSTNLERKQDGFEAGIYAIRRIPFDIDIGKHAFDLGQERENITNSIYMKFTVIVFLVCHSNKEISKLSAMGMDTSDERRFVVSKQLKSWSHSRVILASYHLS
jgi:hypothetical protein